MVLNYLSHLTICFYQAIQSFVATAKRSAAVEAGASQLQSDTSSLAEYKVSELSRRQQVNNSSVIKILDSFSLLLEIDLAADCAQEAEGNDVGGDRQTSTCNNFGWYFTI